MTRVQLKDVDYEATNITYETVFSANKIVTIYEFKLLENQIYEFQYIAEILDNSTIYINYKSFYGVNYAYKAPLTIV